MISYPSSGGNSFLEAPFILESICSTLSREFYTKSQNRNASAISLRIQTKNVNMNKLTKKDVVTAKILDFPLVIMKIHDPKVARDAKRT